MSEKPAEINAAWLRRFRQSLKLWHAANGRDLPWRNCRDPYKVWISEIMLQQTTVAAVKPYFERFLERFPNVASLAVAHEDEVLRLWEGLGYYSRARNLHRAAKVIVEEHAGRFPPSVDELLVLPGVGRYTAGAIVSFAFDLPAPILEANTLRLYSRLLGFRDDPRSTVGQRRLWSFAEKLVPTDEAGEFNQALTDLGATVCTPTEPQCDACPVATCCRALAENTVNEIPRPARRPEITDLHEAAVAIEHKGNFLLTRCPEGARWAGLWDFPRFELSESRQRRSADTGKRTDGAVKQHRDELELRIAENFGLPVQLTERLTQLKHSVTRYRITLDCWLAECISPRALTTSLACAWVASTKFSEYPLSVTGRKLAELIAREETVPHLFNQTKLRKNSRKS